MALTFIKSNKGANLLVIDSFSYRREKVIAGKEIWRCSAYTKWKCMSRCHTKDGIITKTPTNHNHVPDQCKIRGRKVITDLKKRPATMIESTHKMLPKYLKELNSAFLVTLVHIAGFVARNVEERSKHELFYQTTFYYKKYDPFLQLLDCGGIKFPTYNSC
ncbi:uncharacterized protein LOC136088051 [Hydra vulgaris]|uniref:Uncharacterized protein LOC136088051 n=1 Tax=Hydra vulgaris TaxID=6087 RepID=A0ABM4D0K0_HYDVU